MSNILNKKNVTKALTTIIFLGVLIYFVTSVINYILPVKYENLIEKYCIKYDLEKELAFSVINVESRFKKDAVSSKGAIGLMQIMPETGIWLAEKMGLKNFNQNMLYEVETNLNIGCYYLSYLLEKFDKDEKLALCSYNAGITNVYKWLDNEDYSKDGYIHTIPFQETDKYIKKIQIMKKLYKIVLK